MPYLKISTEGWIEVNTTKICGGIGPNINDGCQNAAHLIDDKTTLPVALLGAVGITVVVMRAITCLTQCLCRASGSSNYVPLQGQGEDSEALVESVNVRQVSLKPKIVTFVKETEKTLWVVAVGVIAAIQAIFFSSLSPSLEQACPGMADFANHECVDLVNGTVNDIQIDL